MVTSSVRCMTSVGTRIVGKISAMSIWLFMRIRAEAAAGLAPRRSKRPKMMVERGAPDGQQMSVNRLSRKPAVNKKIIFYIVDRLGLSLFECQQHMAKNKSSP